MAQIFDVVIIFFARCAFKKIILHHNSFSYINKKNYLSSFLFYLAGYKAVHVVNCTEMKAKISKVYSAIKIVKIVSNASILILDNSKEFCFIEKNDFFKQVEDVAKNTLTLGFMGYMNQEKGIDLFCHFGSPICSVPFLSFPSLASATHFQFRNKTGILVGLGCQFLLLPCMGFCVVKVNTHPSPV